MNYTSVITAFFIVGVAPTIAVAQSDAIAQYSQRSSKTTEPSSVSMADKKIVLPGTKIDLFEGHNGAGDMFWCKSSSETCCTIFITDLIAKPWIEVYVGNEVKEVYDVTNYSTDTEADGTVRVTMKDPVLRK